MKGNDDLNDIDEILKTPSSDYDDDGNPIDQGENDNE